MATWSPITGRSTRSVQVATDSAPNAGTDGAFLDNVAGFNLFAEADAGQTFTGSGSFTGYLYDEACGWARALDLDAAVLAGHAGNRRIYLGAFPVSTPRGRVAHAANGVGVSSGGITLYYVCSTLFGERA